MINELLDDNSSDNYGGIARTIYFALASDIETWPTLPAAPATYEDKVTHDAPFIMKSTKQFHKFEATVRKSKLDFESAGERGSLGAINRLEVVRSKVDASIVGFLEEHKNDQLVFIVEDLQGRLRVIGWEKMPATFESFNATTGGDVSDVAEVQFQAESVGPIARFYGSQTIPLTPAA